MKKPDMKSLPDGTDSNSERRFLLFVAGEEPNSRMALANFEKIRSLLNTPCELEIIDVLDDFRAALSYNILVTPTLIQEKPKPVVTIMGNLNNIEKAIVALGLKDAVDE